MRLLSLESLQMETSFFIKQSWLMRNLAQNYWTQVDNKEWQQLFDLLIQKEIYLRKLIANGSKEKQRLKAEQALEKLIQMLNNNLFSQTSQPKSA